MLNHDVWLIRQVFQPLINRTGLEPVKTAQVALMVSVLVHIQAVCLDLSHLTPWGAVLEGSFLAGAGLVYVGFERSPQAWKVVPLASLTRGMAWCGVIIRLVDLITALAEHGTVSEPMVRLVDCFAQLVAFYVICCEKPPPRRHASRVFTHVSA